MTREEQRKLKELKNVLPQILKVKIKKYKLKKKDFMLWRREKDLFFDLLLDVRTSTEGHCDVWKEMVRGLLKTGKSR